MSKPKSEIFWTDGIQAQERLGNTIILYDGNPCYVAGITGPSPETPKIPRIVIRMVGVPKPVPLTKNLDDPLFERFRVLPKVGWMNYVSSPITGPLFISRRPVAGSRLHGLANPNTRVESFTTSGDSFYLEGGNYNIQTIMNDKGFVDMHRGEYPSLGAILANIKEGTGIAYNRDFCVYRDAVGIRWLFHKTNKVGIFTGVDTLNLFQKYSYLRETIMDDETFTLNNIREF